MEILIVIMMTLVILTLITVTPEGTTKTKVIASAITLSCMATLAWLVLRR